MRTCASWKPARDDSRIRGVVGTARELHGLSKSPRWRRSPSNARRTRACTSTWPSTPWTGSSRAVQNSARRPIQRLERYGLLDDRALLAHGIHVGDEDYDRIAAAGATVMHNPESNANNGVGRLDIPRAAGRGCAIGLGTDGMSSAVLRALQVRLPGTARRLGRPDVGLRDACHGFWPRTHGWRGASWTSPCSDSWFPKRSGRRNRGGLARRRPPWTPVTGSVTWFMAPRRLPFDTRSRGAAIVLADFQTDDAGPGGSGQREHARPGSRPVGHDFTETRLEHAIPGPVRLGSVGESAR